MQLRWKEKNYFTLICAIGEIISSDFSCNLCPQNTYSLLDPMQNTLKYQKCTLCPENAYCPGGKILTPIPGYFRYQERSLQMIPCINENACLGYFFTNETDCDNSCQESNLIHGACMMGNEGALCFNCKIFYGHLKQKFH